MTINNCIVIIVINISHKYQIRKTMKKTCIKCRKYYKNFKSVTQIKNQRKNFLKFVRILIFILLNVLTSLRVFISKTKFKYSFYVKFKLNFIFQI